MKTGRSGFLAAAAVFLFSGAQLGPALRSADERARPTACMRCHAPRQVKPKAAHPTRVVQAQPEVKPAPRRDGMPDVVMDHPPRESPASLALTAANVPMRSSAMR